MKTLDQIKNERQKKLQILVEKGVKPYPSFNKPRLLIKEARDKMNQKVEVAGKVFSIRGHGKLLFIDLHDGSGKIQLMFKADAVSQRLFEDLNLIDVGDYLYATGKVTKTIRGEISVLVEDYEFLAKALNPLPEKWHGLKDVEERYRQRYVDLLVNEDVKDIFLTRTEIIQLLRNYLNNHGFIEVETPVLQQIYGGASAKPFITHHNALDTDLYLRISDELFLKRLVVAGFEKVYELAKDFRNEGVSRAHNPEFTMLEFYWAYANYEKLMQFTEQLFSSVIKEIKCSLKIRYKDKDYDLTPPWQKITYKDLFINHLKIDIDKINNENLLVEEIKKRQLLPEEKNLVG